MAHTQVTQVTSELHCGRLSTHAPCQRCTLPKAGDALPTALVLYSKGSSPCSCRKLCNGLLVSTLGVQGEAKVLELVDLLEGLAVVVESGQTEQGRPASLESQDLSLLDQDAS